MPNHHVATSEKMPAAANGDKLRHLISKSASYPLEASMLEVVVDHLGDVQFEVTARGHRIYCDQPVENGGFDEGMTPPEFLLASLGACAGFYAAQYLKANRLPVEALKVRVQAEKSLKPARLGEFTIDVQYAGELMAKQHAALHDAVHKCLIHNTLLHPPKIAVNVSGVSAGSTALAA